MLDVLSFSFPEATAYASGEQSVQGEALHAGDGKMIDSANLHPVQSNAAVDRGIPDVVRFIAGRSLARLCNKVGDNNSLLLLLFYDSN